MTEWKSVHIWKETYRMLRMLAALRGVTHGQYLHEVILREFKSVGLDKVDRQVAQ